MTFIRENLIRTNIPQPVSDPKDFYENYQLHSSRVVRQSNHNAHKLQRVAEDFWSHLIPLCFGNKIHIVVDIKLCRVQTVVRKTDTISGHATQ